MRKAGYALLNLELENFYNERKAKDPILVLSSIIEVSKEIVKRWHVEQRERCAGDNVVLYT